MKKIAFMAVISAFCLQACNGSKAGGNTDSSATTHVDSATAGANSGTNKNAATKDSAAVSDTAFASKAAIGGMAEVALGKMAAAKGQSAKIKDFGNMMITDHGKANSELKSIATAKQITLPTDLDAEHQAKSDSLSKLSGKQFDAAYAKAMVEGHQKTLKLMQTEAANGKDAELKAFAAKTAPVVQMHLTEIIKIQNGLK